MKPQRFVGTHLNVSGCVVVEPRVVASAHVGVRRRNGAGVKSWRATPHDHCGVASAHVGVRRRNGAGVRRREGCVVVRAVSS